MKINRGPHEPQNMKGKRKDILTPLKDQNDLEAK